jgi:ammonia channel protein AmtB
MQLFANASGHDWTSFALGVVAGIICLFAVKRYNKKKGS